MPGQCGKELGFSGVRWRRSSGRQAISRPANGVRLNPFNSMAPGSVRKPLVTLFQRSRLEECLSSHNRAALANRFPLWSRAYAQTTQVEDASGSYQAYPAEARRRNRYRCNHPDQRPMHSIAAIALEIWSWPTAATLMANLLIDKLTVFGPIEANFRRNPRQNAI